MSLNPVVAAAIVDSLNHPTAMLAASRAYPSSLEGLYELPGGKVELNENPLDALVREIEEELGTRLTLGSPLEPPTQDASAAQDVPQEFQSAGFTPWKILNGRAMWVWFAEIAQGAPEPKAGDSHHQIRWSGAKDLLNLPWISTNRPIVAHAIHTLDFRPGQTRVAPVSDRA